MDNSFEGLAYKGHQVPQSISIKRQVSIDSFSNVDECSCSNHNAWDPDQVPRVIKPYCQNKQEAGDMSAEWAPHYDRRLIEAESDIYFQLRKRLPWAHPLREFGCHCGAHDGPDILNGPSLSQSGYAGSCANTLGSAASGHTLNHDHLEAPSLNKDFVPTKSRETYPIIDNRETMPELTMKALNGLFISDVLAEDRTPKCPLTPPLLPTLAPDKLEEVKDMDNYDIDNECDDRLERSDDSVSDTSLWMSDYSDPLPVLGDGHPFLQIKSEVVERTLTHFAVWPTEPSRMKGPQPGTAANANNSGDNSSMLSNSPSSKENACDHVLIRKRDHYSVDQKEDTIERGTTQDQPMKRARTTRQAAEREMSFACPFAKKDFVKYRNCYSYTLKRIQDVRQHLVRCHQLPIYCPRCKAIFANENELNDHAESSTPCEVRSDITYEGVTRTHKYELSKRASPKMTAEEHWYQIFNILFPKHASLPNSPFLNAELSQDLDAFQEMMIAQGPKILQEVLQKRGMQLRTVTNDDCQPADLQLIILREGLQSIAQTWTSNIVQTSATSSIVHTPSSSRAGVSSNVENRVPSPAAIGSTADATDTGAGSSQLLSHRSGHNSKETETQEWAEQSSFRLRQRSLEAENSGSISTDSTKYINGHMPISSGSLRLDEEDPFLLQASYSEEFSSDNTMSLMFAGLSPRVEATI